MRVWSEGEEFKSLALRDEEILQHMTRSEIETSFDLEHQLRHVDAVFERVFGG
jgi:adenylosuccinate lyase